VRVLAIVRNGREIEEKLEKSDGSVTLNLGIFFWRGRGSPASLWLSAGDAASEYSLRHLVTPADGQVYRVALGEFRTNVSVEFVRYMYSIYMRSRYALFYPITARLNFWGLSSGSLPLLSSAPKYHYIAGSLSELPRRSLIMLQLSQHSESLVGVLTEI
jgi:hypothetical protein